MSAVAPQLEPAQIFPQVAHAPLIAGWRAEAPLRGLPAHGRGQAGWRALKLGDGFLEELDYLRALSYNRRPPKRSTEVVMGSIRSSKQPAPGQGG